LFGIRQNEAAGCGKLRCHHQPPAKAPTSFQIANKINGFEHISGACFTNSDKGKGVAFKFQKNLKSPMFSGIF
jgi:hypothetical protein